MERTIDNSCMARQIIVYDTVKRSYDEVDKPDVGGCGCDLPGFYAIRLAG